MIRSIRLSPECLRQGSKNPLTASHSNHQEAEQGASQIADQIFFQKVYELVRQVPPGRVVTYGQIAAALGSARRARMVGWAMRACPEDVPWHRVVNSKGGLSIRSPSGASGLQRALLEDEGVEFDSGARIDLRIYGWDEFKP